MNISLGWFCLVGGVVGAASTAIAKTFHRSDFANQEGVISGKEREAEVLMTPLRRWFLVGICVALAIYGVMRIQRDHGWNPFHSVASSGSTPRSRW
jgi:hypothetical protein